VDLGVGEAAGEGAAGELRTLVGIGDLRPAENATSTSSRASAQNATSIVFDSRLASIARENQSIIATRQTSHPIGM
jgi:hypothetical protein